MLTMTRDEVYLMALRRYMAGENPGKMTLDEIKTAIEALENVLTADNAESKLDEALDMVTYRIFTEGEISEIWGSYTEEDNAAQNMAADMKSRLEDLVFTLENLDEIQAILRRESQQGLAASTAEDKFADPYTMDAIQNAPDQAKYRLTNDPQMGCLMTIEDDRGPARQPWVLKMPLVDWSPFLDAMKAAGKALIPDPDPDDGNDCTPPW